MFLTTNLWFFCALGTAVLWGLGYAISDKIMRDSFSPIFLMLSTGIIYLTFSLVLAFFTDNLKPGFEIVMNNPKSLWGLSINAITVVVGSFLILYAINLKNATSVNLIEITYPIFTLIFAYILMREIQINAAVIVGGLLIFSGVIIIYLKA